MEQKRWQDWVILVLGLWLFFSPFFLAYGSLVGVAAWNSYVLGAVVMLVAIWALTDPRKWEEWVNLLLALWLIVAPFGLNFFDADAVASWNQIILGVLIGADAISVLTQQPTARHA